MQHQGKNAEKSGTANGFGSGVSMSEGDYKPDLIKSALMRVARLLGKDDEIADILRSYIDPEKKLSKIPGEVNHRLRILTMLAILVLEHRTGLNKMLEDYNAAYGLGRWSTNKKVLMAMMKEIFNDMHDPRLMLFNGVLAATDPIANYLYTIFQVCFEFQ